MSHFPAATYAQRTTSARVEMDRRGLSALLIFAQESLYYLFGYDGGGYVFFQSAVLTTEGDQTWHGPGIPRPSRIYAFG
jgi:Xaa-Pro dipeptidase